MIISEKENDENALYRSFILVVFELESLYVYSVVRGTDMSIKMRGRYM